MSQSHLAQDESELLVPGISVSSPSPEPNDSPSSVVTLDALDDTKLTPVPPVPRASPQRPQRPSNAFIPSAIPPLGDKRSPFSGYNERLRASAETAVQDHVSRRGTTRCHAHAHNTEQKDMKPSHPTGKRKSGLGEIEDGRKTHPYFSSPWGPSSCFPRRLWWKEVEDYNRQRKRIRFLGWSGEALWDGEADSETACSEDGSLASDSEADHDLQPHNHSTSSTRNRQVLNPKLGGGSESNVGSSTEIQKDTGVEIINGNIEGISITITTSKEGKTTTLLEVGKDVRLVNGVEIVTKTIVKGNEVTIVTTTTLIPLPETEV